VMLAGHPIASGSHSRSSGVMKNQASSGHHLGEGAEMDGLVRARPIHSITNGETDACDQTIRAVVQPYPSAGVNFEVI